MSPALITMLTIENSTRSANTAMMTIVGTLRYGESPWTCVVPPVDPAGCGAPIEPCDDKYTLET